MMGRPTKPLIYLLGFIFGTGFIAEQLLAKDGISLSLGFSTFRTGQEETYDEGVVKIKTSRSTDYNFLDTGFCYTTGGFCIGIKYLSGVLANQSVQEGVGQKNTDTTEVTYSGVAAKVGYMGDTFYLLGSFFANPEKVHIKGEINQIYNIVSAYSVDLGGSFKIGNNLRFGPMLSSYIFNYDKTSTVVAGQTVELKRNGSDNFVVPYFVFLMEI